MAHPAEAFPESERTNTDWVLSLFAIRWHVDDMLRHERYHPSLSQTVLINWRVVTLPIFALVLILTEHFC